MQWEEEKVEKYIELMGEKKYSKVPSIIFPESWAYSDFDVFATPSIMFLIFHLKKSIFVT